MDIYKRLIEDHRKHEKMAKELLKTSGDTPERRKLFEEFRVELESHANAEDQTLYAEMLKKPDAAKDARHSVAEHKEMSDGLEELTQIDMGTGAWLNKFKSVWHMIKHHEDEEEEEIFPSGDEALPASKEKAMVAEFEKRKSEEARTV